MIIHAEIDGIYFTKVEFIDNMNKSLKLFCHDNYTREIFQIWTNVIYNSYDPYKYIDMNRPPKKDILILNSDKTTSILHGCTIEQFDGYYASVMYDYIEHIRKYTIEDREYSIEDIQFKTFEEFL